MQTILAQFKKNLKKSIDNIDAGNFNRSVATLKTFTKK